MKLLRVVCSLFIVNASSMQAASMGLNPFRVECTVEQRNERNTSDLLKRASQKKEEEQKIGQEYQQKLKEIQGLQDDDFDRGHVMAREYYAILQNTKQPIAERVKCCEDALYEYAIIRECFQEELEELKKDPAYLAKSNDCYSLYTFYINKFQTFSYCKHYARLLEVLLKKLQRAMAGSQSRTEHQVLQQ